MWDEYEIEELCKASLERDDLKGKVAELEATLGRVREVLGGIPPLPASKIPGYLLGVLTALEHQSKKVDR